MPEFEFATPEPILVSISLNIGRALVSAGDRTRTTVDVHPRDGGNAWDVTTAELTRVDYRDGELVVDATRAQGLPGSGSVVVAVRVPSGSRLHADSLAADIHGTGGFGECAISTGCGHVRLDRTGPLHLSAALGNVTVGSVVGGVEAVAGSGDITIREIDGAAEINRGTGNTRIGAAGGPVWVYADSGDLHIGRAHAGVEARAARGDIRVDDAVRGPLTLETASGSVEVGIAQGSAAALRLDAHVGTVYQALELLDGTAPAVGVAPTVEVHANTIIGDIVVRRASVERDVDWQ
jgi:DUF4097 and DUF4098 domain-containing protein YvlB